MRADELAARAKDAEDVLVERKLTLEPEELRQAVVAFANTLGDQDTGVVFLGIANDGEIRGIDDPDGAQKNVRRHLQRCYPDVLAVVQTQAVTIDSRTIVAVLVRGSADRPHFTGGAWVRRGSETVRATETVFQALVEDRLSVVRHLRGFVGLPVTLLLPPKPQREPTSRMSRLLYVGPMPMDAVLRDVNAFYVTLEKHGGTETYSVERIQIEYDVQNHRPRIRVVG